MFIKKLLSILLVCLMFIKPFTLIVLALDEEIVEDNIVEVYEEELDDNDSISYTLTIDFNGGVALDDDNLPITYLSFTQEENTSMVLPGLSELTNLVTKENYNLLGLSLNKDSTTSDDLSSDFVFTQDTTLYLIWYTTKTNVTVTFNLSVEGSQEIFTTQKTFRQGQTMFENDIYPDVNQLASSILSQPPFTGNLSQSHIFSGWTNVDGIDVSTNIYEDTLFTGSLTLQRFTVTFVDPTDSLFGLTVNVPFGSNLRNPDIRNENYILPEYFTYTWYKGLIKTNQEAMDAVTNPTPRMPGNSDIPSVNERVIIVPLPNIEISNDSLDAKSVLDEILYYPYHAKVAFNFVGVGYEDKDVTHTLEADMITHNLVLTRIREYTGEALLPTTGQDINLLLVSIGLSLTGGLCLIEIKKILND